MIDKQEVIEMLDMVQVPQVLRSVNQMNLLRNIEIDRNRLKITLAQSALSADFQTKLSREITNAVSRTNGNCEVEIEYELLRPQEVNQIDNVVGIMSGKGGVGKSLIAGLTAVILSHENKNVGVMDADITGPSIPKMFGIKTQTSGTDTGFMPVVTKTGIEVMSMNLLLPEEDSAVIWRGPLISKCINQFWGDVLWGKLDYLVIDMPPGTADVPLTVMKSLPLLGVIIVFTPQDLTTMVVRKAAHMADQLNIPILGLVENMSYFLDPESGKRTPVFGKSKGEEMAADCNAPLLGQIPLDPELSRLCDEGKIENYNLDMLEAFRAHVIDRLIMKENPLSITA